MTNKKSKGVVFNSTALYGVAGFVDAKARLKHQTLVEEYNELQKEANVTRSKLVAANNKKLTLSAEVWFLRRRYKYLIEKKSMDMDILQEQEFVKQPIPVKQAKNSKGQLLNRKEAPHHRLPPLPKPKPKPKKQLNNGKTKASILNHNGRINIKNGNLDMNTPILDLSQSKRTQVANDASLKKPIVVFDLNHDSTSNVKEASLPTRAPIFDLNEISTGDEDFQSNVEEAKTSLMEGIINDEQQNELKLAICRNSGEGSSRVGKRKISWQDPVALRV